MINKELDKDNDGKFSFKAKGEELIGRYYANVKESTVRKVVDVVDCESGTRIRFINSFICGRLNDSPNHLYPYVNEGVVIKSYKDEVSDLGVEVFVKWWHDVTDRFDEEKGFEVKRRMNKVNVGLNYVS